MTRSELRFSGFGGQGVITMAHVLGHAASIHAEMSAAMTEAYGPEKTGGFSRADLVIDDEEIGYPNVVEPDFFVAFSQDAFERDLVDPSSLLEQWDEREIEIVTVPAVELAESVGRKLVANVVMLGATVELAGVVPVEDVRNAIRDIVPDGTERLNERAFDRGRSAIDDVGVEPEVVG